MTGPPRVSTWGSGELGSAPAASLVHPGMHSAHATNTATHFADPAIDVPLYCNLSRLPGQRTDRNNLDPHTLYDNRCCDQVFPSRWSHATIVACSSRIRLVADHRPRRAVSVAHGHDASRRARRSEI